MRLLLLSLLIFRLHMVKCRGTRTRPLFTLSSKAVENCRPCSCAEIKLLTCQLSWSHLSQAGKEPALLGAAKCKSLKPISWALELPSGYDHQHYHHWEHLCQPTLAGLQCITTPATSASSTETLPWTSTSLTST